MSSEPQIDAQTKEREALRNVTDQLAAECAPRHPPDEIAHLVADKRQRYATARVREFVPLLVERDVREELHRRSGG